MADPEFLRREGGDSSGGPNLLFGQFYSKNSMKMDIEPLNPPPLISVADSWEGFKRTR